MLGSLVLLRVFGRVGHRAPCLQATGGRTEVLLLDQHRQVSLGFHRALTSIAVAATVTTIRAS